MYILVLYKSFHTGLSIFDGREGVGGGVVGKCTYTYNTKMNWVYIPII